MRKGLRMNVGRSEETHDGNLLRAGEHVMRIVAPMMITATAAKAHESDAGNRGDVAQAIEFFHPLFAVPHIVDEAVRPDASATDFTIAVLRFRDEGAPRWMPVNAGLEDTANSPISHLARFERLFLRDVLTWRTSGNSPRPSLRQRGFDLGLSLTKRDLDALFHLLERAHGC